MTPDVIMVDGDDSSSLAHSALGVDGASSTFSHASEVLSGAALPMPATHSPPLYGPVNSPPKYILPRLRGVVSPTSPTTLLLKRSLAANAAPNW
ncbi:unnamed protein product [Calypogeia fissa]